MKLAALTALAGLTLCVSTPQTQAQTAITLDVSGMASWDFQGDPDNETFTVFLGVMAPIIEFSWNLNITTVGASWADELTLGLLGNSVIINPALGDSFTVVNQNYQGSIDPQLLVIGADGILDFEFYETGFDDNADAIDAYFEAGSTITIVLMPAPGSLAAMGFAGLFAARRRR